MSIITFISIPCFFFYFLSQIQDFDSHVILIHIRHQKERGKGFARFILKLHLLFTNTKNLIRTVSRLLGFISCNKQYEFIESVNIFNSYQGHTQFLYRHNMYRINHSREDHGDLANNYIFSNFVRIWTRFISYYYVNSSRSY